MVAHEGGGRRAHPPLLLGAHLLGGEATPAPLRAWRVRSLKVSTGGGRAGSPNVRAFLLTVEGPLGRGERGDKSGWAAPLPLRPVAAPWSLKSSWGWRDGALRLRGVRPAIPHEPGGPRGSRRHLESPSRSWWLKARPWHYHTGINGIGPGYTICGTQGKIKVWALCSKRLQALMTGKQGITPGAGLLSKGPGVAAQVAHLVSLSSSTSSHLPSF